MKRNNNFDHSKGFTILELLVSMSIFAIVSAGIVTYISDTLGRLSIETKSSIAMQELKSAINLLQSEIRMSHAASPYNVGIDASVVTCTSALDTTANSIKFLVSYDDGTATNSTRSFYVGYQYDPDERILYRGEVPTGSVASCTLPGTDPLSTSVRRVIATDVTNIDSNLDGTLDNIFSLNSNQLAVRIGVEVVGHSGLRVVQQVINNIAVRVS
jgi:prepilin-type N-terminal cleavage/methylation domain-containing protein